MNTVRASVRQVVEFSLHESDLSPAALRPGACGRARQRIKPGRARARRARRPYLAEQSLSAEYEQGAIALRVSGRADGLLLAPDGVRVVEEIKLGKEDNLLIPAHRAQAAMYGHMSAKRRAWPASVCAFYMWMKTARPFVCMKRTRTARGCKPNLRRCARPTAHGRKNCWRGGRRGCVADELAFPYDGYRAGQRKFAANVYVAIREKKRLFAQAPTGIGKTMAALYPAMLALGEGKCARVLMLTARTTGRKSAMDALAVLQSRGAKAAGG